MRNRLGRRTFLTRTALFTGGIAALGLPASPAFAADDSVSSPPAAALSAARKFELGTVTYNLGAKMKIDDLIATCEKSAFKAVELRTTHAHGVEPEIDADQRKAVRQRFAKSKVKLFSLGSVCEFQSEKAEVVKQNIETCKKFIELAADLGATGVKVRPNGLPKSVPVEDTLKQIGHALQEVGQYGEKHKIEIHVEVHGGGTSHLPHIKTIMETANHPSVGITWNSNDTDVKEGRVGDNFRLVSKWIRNVHLRDLFVDYPFAELFSLLKSIGYDRYTMAEIPETTDPVRVMQYYRKLWEVLSA